MTEAGPQQRRRSVAVDVAGVIVGGGAPVVVQSMTNTDTAEVEGTARQVAALARAGSEIVRITVDRDEAAAAVPRIKERLDKMGVGVPIVGDFHYIGHKLLADHPACAEALDKYRINPGNVGFKDKKDRQFGAIVETAIRHGKPVRIGANWGSLDQELLTRLMDENARSPKPRDAREVTREAMVQSALLSAARAEEIGLSRDRIILSAKVSAVQDLIAVYGELARRSDYALHLGLTEAGMGSKGIVASAAALSILLQQGIGDTIRISLTPEPGGEPHARSQGGAGTAANHGLSRFRAARRRLPRLRPHDLDHLPGARPRHSGLHSHLDARVEAALSRRRVAQCRGHGLHRQRTGRKQARRYRHFASRHWRATGRAGVRRRQEGGDAARRNGCRRLQANGDRLYRAPLRRARRRTHRGGIGARTARRASTTALIG